jgi:hypothetical protein
MSVGSTQPLTEMSTSNLRGCKGRPECKMSLTEQFESYLNFSSLNWLGKIIHLILPKRTIFWDVSQCIF